MTQVAVYGSLRKGLGNHGRLHGAQYIGTTTTSEKYSMYSLGGFPKVSLTGVKTSPIVVEIYECDASVMRGLDQLEGYLGPGMGNFYDRSEVETGLGPALIYHIEDPHTGRGLVEKGDWVEHIKNYGRYN